MSICTSHIGREKRASATRHSRAFVYLVDLGRVLVGQVAEMGCVCLLWGLASGCSPDLFTGRLAIHHHAVISMTVMRHGEPQSGPIRDEQEVVRPRAARDP